ncbi:MAG: MarR family transcriptional regulator [Marivibrio sp.]|uniref:MarR family winged helix-turn-helix transcriptional regulator n=1 Tax=Marivibrio sp. TaxID=2039719 RepID=UPI0032ED7E8F
MSDSEHAPHAGSAAAALADRDVAKLRLWLRILDASNLVQRELRGRLREEFDVTLPRFDLMAALDRAGDRGMTMGQLSRRLRVSNGNVTAVVDRLVKEGAVVRRSPPNDRRTHLIALTDEGRAQFVEMAAAHLGWIDALFADLSAEETAQLMSLMEKARGSLRRHAQESEEKDK